MKQVIKLLLMLVLLNSISLSASPNNQDISCTYASQSERNINAIDPETGRTVLVDAIRSGNVEEVRSLLNQGADPNIITGRCAIGNTAYSKTCALTAAFSYPEILQLLLDSGADINIRLDQRKTPLHYTAESDSFYEALCILLKHGADVNAKDLYEKTPLHLCFYNLFLHNSNRIPFMLLNYGADLHAIDHDGWKPLHRAYMRINLELTKELAERNAPLNEFTPDGGNALYYACKHLSHPDSFALLRFLIEEQGMDLNENSKWAGGKSGAFTPFMTAVISQKGLEDNFEILEYLLAQGADLNTKVFIHDGQRIHIYHNSVLAWAYGSKQPKYIIEWLIEKGAKS